MSLFRSLVSAHRAPMYAVLDRLVLRFHRVSTADLRRVGYAHLEGSGAAAAAATKAAEEHRKEIACLQANAKTPEEREKTLAALAKKDARVAEESFRAMVSTEAGERALVERATAYLLAAVDGGGLLPEPVQAPAVLTEAPEGVQIDAFRLVANEADASTDPEDKNPRVWIETISEARRIVLGLEIQAALDVAAEVLPFRDSPVPAGAGADLAGSGRKAKRDPGVGSRRRGAR